MRPAWSIAATFALGACASDVVMTGETQYLKDPPAPPPAMEPTKPAPPNRDLDLEIQRIDDEIAILDKSIGEKEDAMMILGNDWGVTAADIDEMIDRFNEEREKLVAKGGSEEELARIDGRLEEVEQIKVLDRMAEQLEQVLIDEKEERALKIRAREHLIRTQTGT